MSVTNERKEEIWQELFDEEGNLLYRGQTLKGKPCGQGSVYYPDGTIYQEGMFGVKGFLGGKEYYPNGNLRFSGTYKINSGYGPNYPYTGSFYGVEGNLLYEGKFNVRFGGVGYPIVEIPEEYGPVIQRESPKYHWLMWDAIFTYKKSSRTEENERFD